MLFRVLLPSLHSTSQWDFITCVMAGSTTILENKKNASIHSSIICFFMGNYLFKNSKLTLQYILFKHLNVTNIIWQGNTIMFAGSDVLRLGLILVDLPPWIHKHTRHGSGDFRELCEALLRDPAMDPGKCKINQLESKYPNSVVCTVQNHPQNERFLNCRLFHVLGKALDWGLFSLTFHHMWNVPMALIQPIENLV